MQHAAGPTTLRIGADVGGTFTDIVAVNEEGQVRVHKTLSTPPNYEFAVLEGIGRLLQENGSDAAAVREVTHGTTVATNAVLEHRGARTALITTKGFRDVLELRRVRAPQMYNLFFDKPRAIVERALRFEIQERISATGEVLLPVDEEELKQLVEKLKAEKVESVAVCLLHSYAYPSHELAIGKYLTSHLKGIEVTLSSDVLRERREYERTATASVNAYVRPVMRKYLGALGTGLREIGVQAPLLIMQSTGGLTPDADAAERPVYALESGPAAGVLASQVRVQQSHVENAITFDMGGTTAKASLIENQQVNYSAEYEVGAALSAGNMLIGGGGEVIRAPSIDIAEVGAGGGSIAFVDMGRLRVGPKSAGAVPGPVCYGRGGTEPTVTDANVVLGYIQAGKLADGHITVDLEAAQRAVYNRIAKPLGLSLLGAAEGIHRIANAQIMRALRAVSTQRGRDPRQFVLIAFGGSGPIHAAALGLELSVQRIMVPTLPGLFSAVGLLSSQIEHHDVRSCFLTDSDLQTEKLAAICGELSRQAASQLGRYGISADAIHLNFSADVRFRGQFSEVRIPFRGPESTGIVVDHLRSQFEDDYERLYGYGAMQGDPIEVIAIRLVARVLRPQKAAFRSGRVIDLKAKSRTAFFNGETIETPVLGRAQLAKPVKGPLLIDEYDSTTVVLPGMQAHLDENENLMLEYSHAK